MNERTVWGAVHAARTLGTKHQTLASLTSYLRKFSGNPSLDEDEVNVHLDSLEAKGLVLIDHEA